MEYNTIITTHRPLWLKTDYMNICKDIELYEIIQFFIIHSPCHGQSWKGISLVERGWKQKPWASPKYLKEKLDKAVFGVEKRLLKMADSKEKMMEDVYSLDLNDNYYMHLDQQRMLYSIVRNAGCENEYMSLFYHIRNALAHGRFAMYPSKNNDITFVMEDGKQIGREMDDHFEVSARIVIRKSSLLKIIALLNTPPIENDYSEDIMEAIAKGFQSKAQIIKELQIDEYTYNKYIKKLSINKYITYQHNLWTIVKEYAPVLV